MVKKEGMPKGDMEASKVESPTLVQESAEEQEAREALEAEAATVNVETVALKDAETAILNNEETVKSGIDALAEVELTGEDAVENDEDTEEPEQIEKAMTSAESEAETVDRPYEGSIGDAETVDLTPDQLEDAWFITDESTFNALMAKTELVPNELVGTKYEDYVAMKDRKDAIPGEIAAAKEKAKAESSWYNSWWNVSRAGAGLEVELASIDHTMRMIDGVAKAAETAIDNIESDDSDIADRTVQRQRKRDEKANKQKIINR